jgi:tRNA(fMet)-specific endonuclease VapC
LPSSCGNGVAKSRRKDNNTQRLETFFAGPLEWAMFDEQDARAAGTIRAELESIVKPIGAYDVLLAGQARRRGATLVTSNAREFARIPGLKWEDWALSGSR